MEKNPFQQHTFKEILGVCCHEHSLPEGTLEQQLEHLRSTLTHTFLDCVASQITGVLTPCVQAVLQQLLDALAAQGSQHAPATGSQAGTHDQENQQLAASASDSLLQAIEPASQLGPLSSSQSPTQSQATPGSSQGIPPTSRPSSQQDTTHALSTEAEEDDSAAAQLRQGLIQRLVSSAGPQRMHDLALKSGGAALHAALGLQQLGAARQAGVEWMHEATLHEGLQSSGGLMHRRPLLLVVSRRAVVVTRHFKACMFIAVAYQ